MTGDELPDINHVARHCGKQVHDEGKVLGDAFRLKTEKNETYLSVNCLEHLHTERAEQVKLVWETLSKKKTIGTQSLIAILNCGTAKQKVSGAGYSITLRHYPDPFPNDAHGIDESHCGIDVPLLPEITQAAIAERLAEAVTEVYFARDRVA